MIARQGDVLIVPTTPPTTALTPVARDHGRIVLAYGEVTGHAHAITDPDAQLLTDDTGRRFIQVLADAGVTLDHEEHSTIVLPAGWYEVVGQREYTSADMPARAVAD